MSDELNSILVVDDSIPDLQLITNLLKQNYQVSVATTGNRALEMIAQNRPDMVLLDINLPDISGYDVCRRIRTKDEMLKVVFVSSSNTTEEILKGYDVGGDDYICKPFAPNILTSKIAQAMKHQRVIAAVTSQASGLAMEAMTNLGELGAVLTFLRSSFRATNIDDLGQLLVSYMDNFGLQVSLQLRTSTRKKHFSNNGWVTPIEEELLTRISEMKSRFAESGVRMFIRYDNASLIIKNMPTDDDLKMGRLRDNLAILLEGANEKLAMISLEENMKTTLSEARLKHQLVDAANMQAVAALLTELRSTLAPLSLTDDQQNTIVQRVEKTLADIETNVESVREVEDQLSELLKQFDAKLEEIPSTGGSMEFL